MCIFLTKESVSFVHKGCDWTFYIRIPDRNLILFKTCQSFNIVLLALLLLCVQVLSCLEAKGFIFPLNLKVGDWYEYDSDSDETGDSEELLPDDGHESEGDEAN